MATTITYFIDIATLTDYGYIQGNVNSKVLKTSIKRCQDRFIEPALGSPLYDEIATAIDDDTLTAAQKTLLDKYIRPYLTARVEQVVARRVTQQIRNKTTGRGSDETIQASTNDELTNLRDQIEKDCHFYERKLTGYLCDNESTFPKYGEYRNLEEDVAKTNKVQYDVSSIRRNKSRRLYSGTKGYDWNDPTIN